MRVDEVTGCRMPYTPMGRFVHIPPRGPESHWRTDYGLPWWKKETYRIGLLSEKSHYIRLINTLTSQEHTIEVRQSEELILQCFSGNFWLKMTVGAMPVTACVEMVMPCTLRQWFPPIHV